MIPHNRPFLDGADVRAAAKAVRSGWIAQGNLARAFENKIAARLQRKYAKAVSSGSAALHLSLLALGVKKGGEVILSTYACTALLNAVHYAGARPVLVDIDEKNLGPSKRAVRRKISRRTKAIIVNHAFGFPADILRILSFGVPVIEDCAQSLGSFLEDRPLGSFGGLSVCSFYATKMIAAGYGGMVLTNNAKWAARIRDLCDYDRRRDYKVRYNYSLSDLNAALGLAQLAKLDFFLRRRREIAEKYLKILRGSDLYYWQGGAGERPNFYRFVAGGLKPASYYIRKLRAQGVCVISPLEPCQLLHRYLKLNARDFPAAEAVSRSVFSLPIYPALKDSQIKKISAALKRLV